MSGASATFAHDSLSIVNVPRRCCRPGCPHYAVATLTFVYSDSTAVVGPLATAREPHSWDLCVNHAGRITAPRGWELVRHAGPLLSEPAHPDEDDLVALAAHEFGEGCAEIGDQRLVELFADQPTHVVSLDDTVNSRGGPRHAGLLTT